MNKKALFQIAMAAYDDEMQKIALQSYMEDDEPLTKEAAATYRDLVSSLQERDLVELEKMSEEICSSFVKLAFWNAIGRSTRILGEALSGLGGRIASRAAEPTRKFTAYLTSRGWAPESIQKMWGQYSETGGPLAFIRQRAFERGRSEAARRLYPYEQAQFFKRLRRMKVPAGVPATVGAPEPGMVPMTTSTAGPDGGSWLRKAWPDIRSGALWGLGFAALQRLMAPKQEPEYQIGY